MKNTLIIVMIMLLSIGLVSGAECSVGLVDDCTVSADTTLTSDMTCSDVGGDGCIIISDHNVNLDCNGFTLTGDGTVNSRGISSNFENVTIQNCNLYFYHQGVRVENINNTVRYSNFYNITKNGILFVSNADGSNSSGNTFNHNGSVWGLVPTALTIYEVHNVTLERNSITGGYFAISSTGGINTTISYNVITNTNSTSIRLPNANGTQIYKNNITLSGHNGIDLDAWNCNVSFNRLISSNHHSIDLFEVPKSSPMGGYNNIFGNYINGGWDEDIKSLYIANSYNNTIFNNTIENISTSGLFDAAIAVDGYSNNTFGNRIYNNTIINTDYCFWITSNDTRIYNNTLSKCNSYSTLIKKYDNFLLNIYFFDNIYLDGYSNIILENDSLNMTINETTSYYTKVTLDNLGILKFIYNGLKDFIVSNSTINISYFLPYNQIFNQTNSSPVVTNFQGQYNATISSNNRAFIFGQALDQFVNPYRLSTTISNVNWRNTSDRLYISTTGTGSMNITDLARTFTTGYDVYIDGVYHETTRDMNYAVGIGNYSFFSSTVNPFCYKFHLEPWVRTCYDFENHSLVDWEFLGKETIVNDTYTIDGSTSMNLTASSPDHNYPGTFSLFGNYLTKAFNLSFNISTKDKTGGNYDYVKIGNDASGFGKGFLLFLEGGSANCGLDGDVCYYNKTTYVDTGYDIEQINHVDIEVWNGGGFPYGKLWINSIQITDHWASTDDNDEWASIYKPIVYYGDMVGHTFIDNILLYNESYVYNEFVLDNCSTYRGKELVTYNLLNITDNNTLTGAFEATLLYNADGIIGNFSFDVTDDNISICTAISNNYSSIVIDTHLEYSSGESATFTYADNRSITSDTRDYVPLYLSDNTGFMPIKVTDSLDNDLEGAIVKILKWDVGEGIFKLTQQLVTDFNGDALANIITDTVWYKFIVEYRGEVRLETEPTKISSSKTEIILILDLSSDYYDQATTPLGMFATISWDNSTKMFSYTYSGATDDVDEVCAVIDKESLNGKIEINKTCMSGESGAMMLGIGEGYTQSTYAARSEAIIEGDELILRTKSINLFPSWEEYGTGGIFVSFFLILTIATVGIFNMSVAIILTLIGFILTNVIGIFHMTKEWLVVLILLGIITIVRLNRGRN